MNVTLITGEQVIAHARQTLALPLVSLNTDDEVFLSSLVRRAASIYCPCSPKTLQSVVSDSLSFLAPDAEVIARKIETAVENAIVVGDLLELDQGTIADEKVKATWVFCAPPSFVKRKTGSVLLLGISGEDPGPLPLPMSQRVIFDRHYRRIDSSAGENLGATLREFGLLELSERLWMRAPKQETPSEHIGKLTSRMNLTGPSGDVPDMEVLDHSTDPNFYRGRWTAVKRHSGNFVARRAQAYGAALWGFAQLEDGNLTKFLDLPLKGAKLRGCDAAWHLQMAIDHQNGKPQRYRKRFATGAPVLDFFSPIPTWAERRLAIVGQSVQREHCLMSYAVSSAEVDAEEEFLQTALWLAPTNAQGEKL